MAQWKEIKHQTAYKNKSKNQKKNENKRTAKENETEEKNNQLRIKSMFFSQSHFAHTFEMLCVCVRVCNKSVTGT